MTTFSKGMCEFEETKRSHMGARIGGSCGMELDDKVAEVTSGKEWL